ncbi:hypothetical protein NJ7G_0293 [Natrinema sp. J7-2]|nr:hypothetical protein NJ7G_0293 [Natrinema sp. J7-2]
MRCEPVGGHDDGVVHYPAVRSGDSSTHRFRPDSRLPGRWQCLLILGGGPAPSRSTDRRFVATASNTVAVRTAITIGADRIGNSFRQGRPVSDLSG